MPAIADAEKKAMWFWLRLYSLSVNEPSAPTTNLSGPRAKESRSCPNRKPIELSRFAFR